MRRKNNILNEVEDEIIGNNRSYYQQLQQPQNQNKQGPEQEVKMIKKP